MHVTAVLDAMKKRGHFNDYDRAQKAYEEATKAAESAEAGLALLVGSSAGATSKRKKMAFAKAKKVAKEALVKAHETKPEAKEAVEAPIVAEDLMKDGFQAEGGPELKYLSSPPFSNFWSDCHTENSLFPSPGVG
jgi:hypothetical protein